MSRREIAVGIIGCGLMGRELASASMMERGVPSLSDVSATISRPSYTSRILLYQPVNREGTLSPHADIARVPTLHALSGSPL